MQKVAIYCRLSDEDRDKGFKDESESIQNQKSMLLKYAMEQDWEVYKIYCDEDFSGADRSRPEWNEMITDAENKKFNIVLCKSQSRFSREMEIIEKYIHGLFLEWRIRFISIVDHTDTEVKGNKKARQINGLINEWYLEDLSDNIRKTLNHKKQEGNWMGSFACYGYMRDPENKNHLIIDPDVAFVVRDIFQMFASGKGYHLIAKNLNERGILNPSAYKRSKGSKWNVGRSKKRATNDLWTFDTIYYILRKEEYIGTLVQNKTENISYKCKKRIKHDEKDWTKTPNAHEAILDLDLWERVQNKLSLRSHPNKKGEKHIFAGKVFCECCKNRMYKKKAPESKGGFVYLKCRTAENSLEVCPNNRSIRFDLLEKNIIDRINEILQKDWDSDYIDVSDINAKKSDKLFQEEKALQKVVLKHKAKLEMLYNDKLEGIITPEEFIAFKSKMDNDISSVKKRLEDINAEINELDANVAPSYKLDELKKMYQKIETLDMETLDRFVEKIHIGKVTDKLGSRDISVSWTF